MRAISLNSTTALAVSRVPCSVQRLQGYFKGTEDRWLQIFDWEPVGSAAEPPATDTVPTKVYALPYDSPFSWAFDPGSLVLTKGCYVGVSNYPEKYAPTEYSAGTVYLDVEVDYGPYSFVPSDYVVVGDLSTEASELQVWQEADGAQETVVGGLLPAHRLFKVDYVNHAGVDSFLMVFAKDFGNMVGGERPIYHSKAVADGETLSLCFGSDGLVPVSYDDRLEVAPGTRRVGCLLVESSTAETYTPSASAVSHFRAYYK